MTATADTPVKHSAKRNLDGQGWVQFRDGTPWIFVPIQVCLIGVFMKYGGGNAWIATRGFSSMDHIRISNYAQGE